MLDFFFFFFFLTLNPTTTTTTALRFSLLFIAITSVSLLFQITTRRLFAFILLHLSVVLYASLPESWQFPLLRTLHTTLHHSLNNLNFRLARILDAPDHSGCMHCTILVDTGIFCCSKTELTL